MSTGSFSQRRILLRRGIVLSAAVVVWNIVEGIIAVGSGLVADSVALLSFGIDSFIEVASGVVVWWRLHHELRGDSQAASELVERRTARITGSLLLVLAVYIVLDAGRRILGYGGEPAASFIGIVLTGVSLLAMPLLGWAKLKTSDALDSPSMRSDAFETIACAWLSVATLSGLMLNAILGFSWADPVAALVIVPLVVREGLEGLNEESDHE